MNDMTKPPRILVVDDCADAADGLALFLRMEGVDARAAYSGPQALLLARSWSPDVAVLDLSMPGMDGFELAVQLSRLSGHERQPRLIALTGWDAEQTMRQCATCGFVACLTKPVEPALLIRWLRW